MKWADYVHFYSLGRVAVDGPVSALYDQDLLHERQVALVPDSAREVFQPTYPPQAALLFAPFSLLPYWWSGAAWAAVTLTMYVGIVISVARRTSLWADHQRLVLAAALAFPPVWQLVVHGQTTIVVLASFWAAWCAWERGRGYLAGFALGFLALKPQFLAPVGLILLAGKEWRAIAGVATSALLQAACVTLTLGPDTITAFLSSIPATIGNASLLEPKAHMTHSIRALTKLVPGVAGTTLWVVAAAVVLIRVALTWRDAQVAMQIRLTAMILGAVLVSPHLNVYDATVLALPLIWISDWIDREAPMERAALGAFLYVLFLTFLAPTAAIVRVQVSVILLTLLLFMVCSRRAVFWPVAHQLAAEAKPS